MPSPQRLVINTGPLMTGTIGILLRAKREAKLTSIRSILDKMKEHGVWLSARLYSTAITLAGE